MDRLQQQDALIGWFAALAVVIHVFEAGLPSPVPGIKPGLANVITLVVLARHGLAAALWVGALRVLAGSLVIGTFLTPTFALSAGGAAASLAILALAARWNAAMPAGLRLSLLGMGCLAAVAHMSVQFLIAWRLFVPHPGLLSLLPVLLLAALLFGICTGWLANALVREVDKLAPRAVQA